MGITLDELIFDPSNPDDGANVGSYVRAGDDGTAIGHVGDALKVDIGTVADLDIRDLAFATDKVDVTGSEVSLDAASLAALENITVSATDLDIRDLTFATDSVDVSGSSVSFASKASGSYSAATATTTASQLDASPLASRKNITIQNLGNKDIFVGFNGSVTTSTGTKISRGSSADFDWGPALNVFAITDSGTADVRLLQTA